MKDIKDITIGDLKEKGIDTDRLTISDLEQILSVIEITQDKLKAEAISRIEKAYEL